MIKLIIISLIKSFLLTLIIEYLIIKAFNLKKKIFIEILLVNLLTNPLLVFIINICYILNFKYILILEIILEILIIFIEGFVYSKILFDKKKSYLMSCTANIIAYIIGLLLYF